MTTIYLISDDGYADVKGPNARKMANVLIAVAGWRECSEAEYEAMRDWIARQEAAEVPDERDKEDS